MTAQTPDLTGYVHVQTGPFRFGSTGANLMPGKPAPSDWRARFKSMFPDYFPKPFSLPHLELGNWAARITPQAAHRPFVALWARDRGKSTFAEAVVTDWGARGVRKYVGYVSSTQDSADKHVQTIAAMMESVEVTAYYPAMGQPEIGKNGTKSWNRSILRASNGFTVEALGLNKAMRGGKIKWARFDAFVFDDVDEKHDTEQAVKKKEEIITTSILPAGTSGNCAVLFVQNLIHAGSLARRLSRKPGTEQAADYLANRHISGPYPAMRDLAYRFDHTSAQWVITGGESLWEGFTLEDCQAEINLEGPAAFELESQHEIDTDDPQALLTTEAFDKARVSSHPDLFSVGVGVDPSGGAGQCGIIGAGAGHVGRQTHTYTLADFSTPEGTASTEWALQVLRCYHAILADCIVVETNFGGDMVANAIRVMKLYDDEGELLVDGSKAMIIEVNASRGKEVRAQPVANLVGTQQHHHVGYFPELQKQWTKWVPGTKPSPDRLDAETWIVSHLVFAKQKKVARAV